MRRIIRKIKGTEESNFVAIYLTLATRPTVQNFCVVNYKQRRLCI
jgi:hypothetical protein